MKFSSLALVSGVVSMAQAYERVVKMTAPNVVAYHQPFNVTYTIETSPRGFTKSVGLIISGLPSEYDNNPQSIGGYLTFIDVSNAVPGTYKHEVTVNEHTEKGTNVTITATLVDVVQYSGAFPGVEQYGKANITVGDAVSEETSLFKRYY